MLFEFLFELLLQVVSEVVFEALAGIVAAVVQYALDVDFAGNAGRLSGNPSAKVAWYAVAGAACGGASIVLRPERLAAPAWARLAAIALLPLASGLALAAWDAARGRSGDGRRRAAFWAGFAFGVGYAFVRLAAGSLVR